MKSAGAVAALALLGLAACTPQACDPSQAGFFSGIGCEASGSYGVRNQYQRSALAQESSLALQNRANAIDAGQRANDAILSRDEARRRLSSADRRTAQIRASLAAARNRRDVDQTRLDEAQSELARLQRDRTSLQRGASAEQIRAYEERQQRLNDSITGL